MRHLRALKQQDLESYVRWGLDRELRRLASQVPYMPGWPEAEIEGLKSAITKSKLLMFMVQNSDGEAVGFMCLESLNWQNRTADVAAIIGERRHWGTGLALQAGRELVRYAFRDLGLKRLQATVLSFNERAIAWFKKLGFVEEGRLRRAIFCDDGRVDLVVLGLTYEDVTEGDGLTEPDQL